MKQTTTTDTIAREKFNSKILQEFRAWIFDNTANVQLPDGTSYTEQKLNIYDFEQFLLSAIQKTREQTIEEIETKLEKLMDEKKAKELAKNLKLYCGSTMCRICGTDPLKQREMILASLKEKQIKV